MRTTQIESFIRKYGPEAGPELLRVLKTNAANARWKAFYKRRALARNWSY